MSPLKNYRLINTNISSPYLNMAIDEALLYNFNENSLPIFRIYRWQPSISLAKFSKLQNSINLNKLKFDYVRRITGGGILIHGSDISYSLILPNSNEKSVKENYIYICKFLINFYKKLGFMANFAYELNIKEKKSNICLAGKEAFDIVINNQKIGGNAQRYTKRVIFQHGTIPIDFNRELIDIFLEEFELNSITTLTKLGINLSYNELIELLIESFSETFGVEFIDDELSSSEKESIEKLLREKYTKEEWNRDGKVAT